MTKPVRDYFVHCMEDPEFAGAYQELEAEYQTERARIQARIQRGSLCQALKEGEKQKADDKQEVYITSIV